MESQTIQAGRPDPLAEYLTIQEFAERHSRWITLRGLRYHIGYRRVNGLDRAEVIEKLGKSILIHEARFIEWLKLRGRRLSR